MKSYKEVVVKISPELEEFVDKMMEVGGNFYYEIQDVLEHLEEDNPLYKEAEELRKEHGDFYFRA